MFRKDEKTPIIRILMGVLFMDKSYIEGKWWIDLFELALFLAGAGTSIVFFGIFPLVFVIFRKQKRIFKYVREYESLPGGNDS